MSAPPAVCALLLAAGEGRRFDPSGRCWKLLGRIDDGRTMLAASCEALLGEADEVVVVVGAHEAGARAALTGLPVRLVRCGEAGLGPGASIKCGLGASDPSTGWLIALADMPWIRPSTVAAVVAALRQGAPIARPVHAGRHGHPVGFSRSMRTALMGIDDLRGASVLCAPGPGLSLIAVDDPGCLADVDFPADLARPGRVSSSGSANAGAAKVGAPASRRSP